jgi:hypothetical protein
MQTSFDAIVQDALTTVRLVPRWQLPADQWPGVLDALAELEAALASGRPGSVRKALRVLEARGPHRLAAITSGSESQTSSPEPPVAVRELVNQLVHPVTSWTERPASGQPAQESRG